MLFWEIVQQEWALRALAASTMVGVMCGLLGVFIVLRNMALIGDALSHAILPGVVLAFVIFGYSVLGFFAGAVVAGLLTAVGITWIQQKVKTKNDAAVGIVFTAMFSLGVIGISWVSRNEGVHLDLKDFLFGNVLGVSDQDLFLTAGITLYVLASVLLLYRYLFLTTFQPVIAQTMGVSVQVIHYFLMMLLSFAVVAALQTVGVILVVAMLITPAATALLLADRLPLVLFLAAVLGLLSAITGLFGAILLETTPGPAMAVAATLFYLIAVVFAPKKGLLFKMIRRQRLGQRILSEDILKQSFKLEQQGKLSRENLQEALDVSGRKLKSLLRLLRTEKLLQPSTLTLTQKGVREAKRLVRAHRLWETYLVDQIGLDAGQIHEDAERYEHLLTDELLDEVDVELGFPEKDPHGSPIPTKEGKNILALLDLPKKQAGLITTDQLSDQITAQLWTMGLLPDEPVRLIRREADAVWVRQQGKQIRIPNELASKVRMHLKLDS